jgi:hypothetical protein
MTYSRKLCSAIFARPFPLALSERGGIDFYNKIVGSLQDVAPSLYFTLGYILSLGVLSEY